MFKITWKALTFLIIIVSALYPPVLAETLPPAKYKITTMTGQLRVSVADNFETGISQRQYAIRVKQTGHRYRSFPLSFPIQSPEIKMQSGDMMTVQGHFEGDVFVVKTYHPVSKNMMTGDMEKRTAKNRTAPLMSGVRNIIVMILSIEGVGDTQHIIDPVSTMYTGRKSVKGLYEASSFHQLSFDPDTDNDGAPDVFGPLSIQDDVSDNTPCSIYSWADAANKAAQRQGIDLTLYQHRVYLLPLETECKWAGYGDVGCNDDSNGCNVWVRESGGTTIAHELGHNLNWQHASYDDNEDGTIENTLIEEYGDHSGIMGMPFWAQANAPHRDQLEWFEAFPGSLVYTSCSDTIELNPLELDAADTETQVIKIPIPNDPDYYYLSYRRKIGPYPSHPDYADKINIHRYEGQGAYRTLHVTNLSVGETFEDTENNISVTWPVPTGSNKIDYTKAIAKIEIPNSKPTSDFTFAVSYLSVQFNDKSYDSDGTIVSREWNFGDGNTSNKTNPAHTYSDGQTYKVVLTTTDSCGNTNSVTKNITVAPSNPPKADFSFTVDKLNVKFQDTSNANDGNIISQQWNFGDGTTSNVHNPSHNYQAGGTYPVSLTITDDQGKKTTSTKHIKLEGPTISVVKANFDYSVKNLTVVFTDTSAGNIPSRKWDFGDKTTSSETNPSHTYATGGTYSVILTVTNGHGRQDTFTRKITVEEEAPIQPAGIKADFTYSVNGQSAQFTDTSTGIIASRKWDFGDGETSDKTNPSHTYAAAGSYSVTLTITDANGNPNKKRQEISISDNLAPIADFEYSSDNMMLIFTQTCIDDDGTILSYHWDFGDGSTSSEPNPEHRYDKTGDYKIHLTIKDNDGAQSSKEKVITVTQSGAFSPAASSGGGGGGGGCFIKALIQ